MKLCVRRARCGCKQKGQKDLERGATCISENCQERGEPHPRWNEL